MKKDYLKVDKEIRLYKPVPELAEEIFGIIDAQREYLREWLVWVDGTNQIEDTHKFIKDSHRMNLGGQQLNTFILYNGKIAGSVGFVKIDKHHQFGEIGYWLRKDFQGKGIITKSTERLIRYGFEKMNLQRIEIHVSTDNTKSQAIPRRLGFEEEGILRGRYKRRDSYDDIIVFGLRKDEFKV